MKHFVDARLDALAAVREAEITAVAEKVCLIFDLQGKCRALVKPSEGAATEVVQKKVAEIVGPAADVFWENLVWIEEQRTTQANRALFDTVWQQAKPDPPGQNVTFVLDRRLSKDAWFGGPFKPPWPLNEHTPPIISFYSFKGGVGRTTALASLAINLSRSGKRVVAIDFDLEAPGAGSIFAPPANLTTSLGVVDFLLERPIIPEQALNISDFYYRCEDRAIVKDGEPICVVPSGKLDGWYLEKLARVNYEFLYRAAAEDEAQNSPLHDLLKMLRRQLKPEVFLIGSRAGLHDLGGLSLSGLAHLQVLFGLRSQQSWDGLTLVISHLGKEMIISGRTQRVCVVVHAMASPQGAVREEEIRNFKERSYQVFCDSYYDSPDTSGAEWPIPDLESNESPHFPAVLTWDARVMGYSSIADVADTLCEGEYRALSRSIFERVGRNL
jgi:CobQ/CobB/MinD/ParA nucleotide binding domain